MGQEGGGGGETRQRSVVVMHAKSSPEELAAHKEQEEDWASGLRKDRHSIALLLLLYTLQGIPMGLSVSVPLLLQARKVTYSQQAVFSLVSWPFSLKLLWAPVVDAVYSDSFGRRKSWLIPVQLGCGVLMLAVATRMEDLLGSKDEPPNIVTLTAVFFLLFFCMATQDIAVDGWALTMLSPENRPYASTCNAIGQNLGFFLSYVVFLALHSPDFCNSYLRSSEKQSQQGVVNLGGFMQFWGWVFLVTTAAVWLFKPERPTNPADSPLSCGGPFHAVIAAYRDAWKVLMLPQVLELSAMLLTARVAFAPFDAMAQFKLIDKGFREDTLAIFALVLVPVNTLFPLCLTEQTRRPLSTYIRAYPFRCLVAACAALVVVFCPNMKQNDSTHTSYICLVLGVLILGSLPSTTMFITKMAFFNRVADDRIGGTYMTLLNTISNLGSMWPTTLALAAVDTMTLKQCVAATAELTNTTSTAASTCPTGQTDQVWLDGFYIQTCLGVVWGLVWFFVCASRMYRLEAQPVEDWKIIRQEATPSKAEPKADR
eukprot:gb/GEZN01003467.1/.p1 GENE.gb/GEZN01003467.1/~~gb/GEZN01003467.1/.p1  ORF type:complete len:541 (+),score=72.38 gb/GEZN01003467.1/:227-1849(+)